VIGSYRDPLGGHWVLLIALPIDAIEATPYQRELSPTHAARLAGVLVKVGQFLDPVIAVRHEGAYWTPNGMHRLSAMRSIGARTLTALLVPDESIALRILALNTEKAHNLKDKSLEVVRMAHALAGLPGGASRPERDWAFEFEEPAYLTLGLAYEERPRFSGGVYQPVLKRVEEFSSEPIRRAMKEREKRRKRLLALDDKVTELVDELRNAGLRSAYLKPFVVARLNPLRFVKAPKPGMKAPRAEFEATLDKMLASADRFDATKVRPQDLAAMAGAPPPEE
jgi:ParB family chromosome partitioning protein